MNSITPVQPVDATPLDCFWFLPTGGGSLSADGVPTPSRRDAAAG